MRERTPSGLQRYGAALAVSVLTTLLALLLWRLAELRPVLLILAAVLVSAWYGGVGPGMLAAALCLVGSSAVVPPEQPEPEGISALVGAGVYFLVTGGGSWLVAAMRSAQRRAEASRWALEASEERYRQLNVELEQRVRERTAQLESVNHELEAFAYSVSHDLRSPLRTIAGFSQAVLEDCAESLDEQGREHLQRVSAAAQRMGQLIDDLLNLSRVSRSTMQRKPVNLSLLARQIEAELRQAAPERDVTLVVADGLVAEGDPSLLRVVLENLLGNAWKYTATRTRAHIEFGSARLEGRTVYFVRDDGVGFDMAYVDKLFGAFQRLHTSAQFEGTGIGLATVRRIIQRHGGQVWAQGEVDRGASVYFTL